MCLLRDVSLLCLAELCWGSFRCHTVNVFIAPVDDTAGNITAVCVNMNYLSDVLAVRAKEPHSVLVQSIVLT